MALLALPLISAAQQPITPESLWGLGKVGGMGISKDQKNVIFSVQHYNIQENKGKSVMYTVPVIGGNAVELASAKGLLPVKELSPDGKHTIEAKEVKINKVEGKDFYPELTKSNVQIYDDLNYRHWDTWEDGLFGHIFVDGKDIMAGEPYDSPQKPFGGDEDYLWSPDSKWVLYVTKKKAGKAYAVSTNTDIYAYSPETGVTKNLTEGMMGYDVSPAYSSTGNLAWLSMKSDGYEADKNDIIVMDAAGIKTNLTAAWDGTVNGFLWSKDGKKIYFTAPVDGTIQLFEVDYPGRTKKMPLVKKITEGMWDVNDLVGQTGNTMVVSRSDMNHASELYTVDLTNGYMKQLSHVNDAAYGKIAMSKVEKRYTETTDGKKMLSWVIYPPNFDPNKKYPTLLYCQGGPESALTQFYSFRWNFQLMAANGYIVVAPNRRGMPGHGVEWNAKIAKDFGGQVMDDYLSAIDDVAKESYVDKSRIGCVGASYGGYSVFYLAGNHNNRFKTFISHDGIFDWRSMYGSTEELFFVNWDLGGAYWEKDNAAAQKTYSKFDAVNFVNNWNRPIMIIQGGKDYRVPTEQGLAAFQAAQLKGLKSKLLYFPEENHWILKCQNGLVWQKEFFKWLQETL
ncbi:MAG: S9 family peptidase [Bacteroidota bacterium]